MVITVVPPLCLPHLNADPGAPRAPDSGGSMKIARYLIPTGLILCAFTIAAAAQDVRTDYDHNANFSQYHT